jgi:hypothetical protein
MMTPTRTQAIAAWAWHQAALAALGTVIPILEAAGVTPVVVKGMVLAYELHEDVAERRMLDVDLRVRPRDLARAVRALNAHGYRCGWESKQLGAVTFDVGRVLVEIEASVGPPGLCALSVSRMLSRSRERILPGGLLVHEPELHDHAVLLVVNAFKDKMHGSSPWSVDDLERITRRIDPNVFLERVAEARLRAVTWIVANWMARRQEDSGWRTLRDRIGPQSPSPRYSQAMLHLIDSNYQSVPARVLARLGSDSLPRKVWAIAATCAGMGVSWIAPRL